MRFSQRFDRDPETIFLFFEDLASQALYLPCALRVFGQDTRILCLPCANKREVLAFWNEMKEIESAGAKVLFFVDRDYDDIYLPQKSSCTLYVTRLYSIESYVCNDNLVRAFLNETLCHTFGDDYTNAVVKEFHKSCINFVRLMIPLMLVGIAYKTKGHAVNLSNVKIQKVIKLDSDFMLVRSEDALTYFKRSACHAWQSVSIYDLARVWKIVRHWCPRRQIRGKYHLWFVQSFLEQVQSQMRAAARPGQRAPYINVVISAEAIFSRMVTSVTQDLDVLQFLAAARHRWGYV